VGHVNDLGAWTQNGRDMTLDYPTYIKALVDYIPAYYADGMPLPVNLSGAFAASPAQPDSFSIVPCHLDANNPSEPIFTARDRLCGSTPMPARPCARNSMPIL